jgi:Glycosyl hydrolase family 3 N terminal domain
MCLNWRLARRAQHVSPNRPSPCVPVPQPFFPVCVACHCAPSNPLPCTGANVQLGPGVCLARVPVNGRNFEYLSGEDPFLGYTMVQPVIKGIQSQGVIANAKHFMNNNQETNRQYVSANVDERRGSWRVVHHVLLQPY